MSAAATTAPKRLLTRSTCSSVGPASEMSALMAASTSVPAPLRPQRADAPRQEADDEQQEQAERELPGVGEVRARERADDLEHGAGDEHRGDAQPSGEDRDENELTRGRTEAGVSSDGTKREDDERDSDRRA